MPKKLRMGALVRATGWNPKTIRRAIKLGRLPASTTPGGQYEVAPEDLKKATALVK